MGRSVIRRQPHRRLPHLVLVGLVLLAAVLPSWFAGPLDTAPPSDGRLPAGVEVVQEKEPVEISTPESGDGVEEVADIDSGATFSSIDDDLAREIGVDFKNAEEVVISSAMGQEYRPLVGVRIRIAGQTLDTKATVAERDGMDNQVLVGRRDLRGFLIRVGGDREDASSGTAQAEPSALAVLRGSPPQPDTLTLLMALPLVALLIMAAQALLGLRTFGLFVPVLLSLAFVQIGLPVGLAAVGAALVLGLVIGRVLDLFRLRPIARLTVLLVAAVNLALAAILLLDGPVTSPGSVVFVLAVAALVVERLWTVSEREGSVRSWEAACWTLLIAAASSPLLAAGPVLTLTEDFPFLWGTLAVAAAVLVGRFRGPSLVELVNSRLRRRGKTAEKAREE